MESKISKKFTKFGLISLFLILCHHSHAMFWGESMETVRLALFRAGLKDFSVFNPFVYSADLYHSNSSDPERLDQMQNCKEWQDKIGKSVHIKDIDKILYYTNPAYFECAYQEGSLASSFAGNTFVKALLLPKNAALLSYLSFAKKIEYYYTDSEEDWETWENEQQNLTTQYFPIFVRLDTVSDEFLQMRYAFLMLRHTFQLVKNTAEKADISYYEKYIKPSKSNTIIKKWALLYKAMMTEGAEGNYLYSLVFDRCHEKKFISYYSFDKSPTMLAKTLQYAQNDHEKGVIRAISIINNPRPQLTNLKKIYPLMPNSPYFYFLVQREINKLEDWLFTSKYSRYRYESEERTNNQNTAKDKQYLQALKVFLQEIYPKTKGEQKDFLAIAIAHLCFMQENMEEGKGYLYNISAAANATILNQKNIELALLTLKTQDIRAEKTQHDFWGNIRQLEKIAQKQPETYKTLHTLLRIACDEYEKIDDLAIGGLLHSKSVYYKYQFDEKMQEWGELLYSEERNVYANIGYFDRKARIKDMDKLIFMLEKKHKTPFETFLCAQTLASTYFYKDVKGTIAFRNSDLKLAYETFRQIPDTFWEKQYQFAGYLNENPFEPLSLSYKDARYFHFPFHKTEFLQELLCYQQEIQMYPQKKADHYLQLGHAYLNCTFWGNSWMMAVYGQSQDGRTNFYSEHLYGSAFGEDKKNREKMFEGNYLKGNLAKKYYLLALQNATNDEQRAMASLMIHICTYKAAFPFGEKNYHAGKSLMDFYTKYAHTAVFESYSCPLLADFVK